MCLFPRKAHLLKILQPDGEIISRLDFSPLPRYRWSGTLLESRSLSVACRRCVECEQLHANEWGFRCYAESKLYRYNSFITLTYDDEHNPVSLVLKHVQDFIKRLRSFVYPQKIRFFYCGEYGALHARPHYHLCVFGWKPPDQRFLKISGKMEKLFTSSIIGKLWKYGFHTVGEVTQTSAKYCAKYMQKFNVIPDGLTPPFCHMSTRPGIGYNAINVNCLKTGRVYGAHGYVGRLPRYWHKVLAREYPIEYCAYKEKMYDNYKEISEKELDNRRKKWYNHFKKIYADKPQRRHNLKYRSRDVDTTKCQYPKYSPLETVYKYNPEKECLEENGQRDCQEIIDSYADIELSKLLDRYLPEEVAAIYNSGSSDSDRWHEDDEFSNMSYSDSSDVEGFRLEMAGKMDFSSVEKPVEEKPVEEKPVEEKPVEEKPVEEKGGDDNGS